ncbi:MULTISPECIES: efflux RND transporter periplasmic adaptor subunit [unclassified Sphingomonas]|jgi:cobalt-zinc-cadmium efflux system membrane fusion protein|uniref:efflux RND transporter periplasmic adaptor subunit n=1 Tax=unclassified Sphingomonas TaxID=196159 RepID=UPI00082E8359|nr:MULTISPECIES: efflux RND transporter periplasmic adaptor subunit [unclassified Sphingomonas]
MNFNDKRLLGGVSAAVLVAAVGGFSIARLTSPSAPAAAAQEAKKDEPLKGEAATDSVAMTADAIKAAGIETGMVNAGGLGAEIVAQGTVTASPNGEAMVTARAGGAVIRVFKRLGDSVRAGEPLAIVESRDAAQLASERTVANARAELARKNLERERYLVRQRVSARVDLERAEADYAAAQAEVRRAQVSAGAARVTSDGRGVIVTSPISGRVTAASITLGAYVQPETELFRVADPRLIQVEAAVGSVDAGRVAPGDTAVVEMPNGRTVNARVRAVTPTLNGETRAATAVLDVDGGELQPGLAVRVRLKPSRGETSSAIVVPEEAVQSVEGRDVVFVRNAAGFRAVPVSLGRRSAGRVEVLTGLSGGQTIATRQAFLLKAELSKGTGEEE